MFKPLMSGMFNAIAVNRKLREIWAAIDEIKEFQEPEGVPQVLETVSNDTITADEAETETKEVEFDDMDGPALKKWAMDTHSLKITGNKKADTIREEIKEFLKQGV